MAFVSPPRRARLVERSSAASGRPRNAKFERCSPSSWFHEPAKSCACSSLQSTAGDFRRAAGAPLSVMAQAPVLPRGFELPLEPRLPRIGSVDAVALEERAASLAKRSIKREAKVFALELAIRCMDLTTLEGADTPGKVGALCTKAVRPDPADRGIPSVAAVCVYPNLVPTAVERLH